MIFLIINESQCGHGTPCALRSIRCRIVCNVGTWRAMSGCKHLIVKHLLRYFVHLAGAQAPLGVRKTYRLS